MNKKQKDYRALMSYDRGELQRIVNSFLEHGYICVGGIAVAPPKTTSDGCPYYFQSVVKPV